MTAIRAWNEILRHERELRGLSQGEIAEALGTDQKVGAWLKSPKPLFSEEAHRTLRQERSGAWVSGQ
jgi:transcriptional regulator with XRE-family HTH domain